MRLGLLNACSLIGRRASRLFRRSPLTVRRLLGDKIVNNVNIEMQWARHALLALLLSFCLVSLGRAQTGQGSEAQAPPATSTQGNGAQAPPAASGTLSGVVNDALGRPI